MMQKRENFIVLCTTVLFGILSRALVGIPYMVWSHFDKTFLLSFLLWALYTGIMYCAVKAAAVSSGRRITLFTASLLFGLTAACAKTGFDALTGLLLQKSRALFLASFLNTLIFGSAVILFLYFRIIRPCASFQSDTSCIKKRIQKYAGVLILLAGTYIAVSLCIIRRLPPDSSFTGMPESTLAQPLYMNAILEAGNIARYTRSLSTVSAVFCTLFFLTLWIALQNTAAKESSNHTRFL